LKKLNFGEVKEKKSKSEIPVMDGVDASKRAMVDALVHNSVTIETLTKAVDDAKEQLTGLARPYWFEHNNGKSEIFSSVKIKGNKEAVMITFKNQYKAIDEGLVKEVFPRELQEKLFLNCFEVKIDGSLIPELKAQAVVDDLNKLMVKHGIEGAISFSQKIKPKAEFHESRHSLFDTSTNLQLQEILPVASSVKVKGVV